MHDMLVVFSLIILHGVDGREINLNVEEITSIQCKMPGVDNKLFVDSANAIVNTTDGKLISVRESCYDIREIIKEAQK